MKRLIVALALAASLGMAGNALALDKKINIFNGAQYDIYTLYLSPTNANDWEENLLKQETLPNGDKVDMTTSAAAITNSTAVMMTSVAGDPNAIGYISLGSLDDTVKAVSIDGVAPTAAAVKDGSYAIARPFNIVPKGELAAPAADFLAFIMSTEGQAVVSDNNYIAIDDAAAPFASNGVSGKVVVAGSSSVTPVMEKLAEAYKAINSGVTIEVNQSDSTTGVNMATEGTCDIGMASRELKDSETGVTPTVIAQDGIAVIVNNASNVDGLSSEQVKGIYTGEIANWEDVLA